MQRSARAFTSAATDARLHQCGFAGFVTGIGSPMTIVLQEFFFALCAGTSGKGCGTPAVRLTAHDENANGSIAANSAAKARSGRSTQSHRERVIIVPSPRSS
jgi:hypothetical protein